MKVGADFWVDDAEKQKISGGTSMTIRRLLVVHCTAGASAQSSIDDWKQKADGILAHFVIDRDGKLIQCRALNLTAGHVGGAGHSRWRDPKTGKGYDGLNKCSIGIELANAGSDEGALKWARRQPGFASMRAKHRNGGPMVEWELYRPVQMVRLFSLAKCLVDRFNLDDVTGHDCVAPEHRDDPGPAFPMADLRGTLGFAGLPVVFKPGSV